MQSTTWRGPTRCARQCDGCAMQDGKPAQIQRRVTLVRSSGTTGEEENGAPSAQRQLALPSSAAEPETPKRKKAKAVHMGAQQPGGVELRLEDIMVKQVRARQTSVWHLAVGMKGNWKGSGSGSNQAMLRGMVLSTN